MGFDLSKPEARAIPSGFGGGWIIPLTDRAKEFLSNWFREILEPLAPLGGQVGFIVEPRQTGDLANALIEAGIPWEISK